jgi:hypothetical protein
VIDNVLFETYSYDVMNLYHSIPLTKAIDYITELYAGHDGNSYNFSASQASPNSSLAHTVCFRPPFLSNDQWSGHGI